MPFAPGVETVVVVGRYQDPSGEPARGFVELQLKQSTSDSEAEVLFTQKKLKYELDGNGEFQAELIKTGGAVNLTREVQLIVTENITGARKRTWNTILNDAGIEEGVFQLASAAETTTVPLNQYVLLGTYSSGLATKASTTYVDTQLATKAPINSPAFTGTPTGITKSHVGLGNVDNTSDANKPISTATQTALNGKEPLNTVVTKSSSYTLAIVDANTTLVTNSEIIVPSNTTAAVPIGSVIKIINSSGSNINITQGSGATLNSAPGTGTRALATRAVIDLIKTATNTWYIQGTVT